MDSRKYSMYRCFCSIPEDAFILCIGFFYRFRKMLLEAEIIDSVFYVSHHGYMYIQNIYLCVYIYMYTRLEPCRRRPPWNGRSWACSAGRMPLVEALGWKGDYYTIETQIE